jgi:Ca-activated chloride channel family protein
MVNWAQLHLMRPEWLWLLLPAVLLTLLLWRLRGRSGGWSDVIAPELLPYLVGDTATSRGPNLLPFILLSWVLGTLAAAGPSWEKIPQPVQQNQDAMVLVLDLSYSMKAGDLSPSRLDRAQQKLLDLLKQRKEGQTALIAYAGDAHIVTPLTDDNPTIANLLPVLSPDMMPVPGSNTPAAISQAIDLMHSAGVSQGQIVLITDGVDSQARKAVAKLIQGSGMQLSILGVGTAIGAPIPLPGGGFLKDDQGTIIIPKLDRKGLDELADDAGGSYRNMQIDDSDLDSLQADLTLPGNEQTLILERTADSWDDKGYLLILLLLPLVLPLFRRGWLLCLLPLFFIGAPEQAHAQIWDDLWLTPNQQGQRALESGDHKAATELFEDSEWAGTAAYRGEEYEAAAKQFSKGDTGNEWYNRGNALAKAGQIDEAIAAYKESLALQPDRVDATENLALLEQQKEQQEEQQESGEDGDQQENQEDQSGDPSESEEQGEPGEQQDGEQEPSDQKPEEQESESPEDPSDSEEQPEDSGQEEQSEDGSEEEEVAPAQAEEASPEDLEKEQAMQQWLRRIPDDPSGLLREKFKYESRQRQQQGEGRQNESTW